MDNQAANEDLELFKLDMCKKYLNSEMLDPRIQGIRDLNEQI